MKHHCGGHIVLIICGLMSFGCKDKVIPPPPGFFPPLGAAFSAAGGEVTFFDLATGGIIDERGMNGYTYSASFALAGTALYMTDNHADNVAIYELPEFAPLGSLSNGGVPLDLCINRAATLVYLINANGNLRRYNQIDGEVDTIGVGLHPRRLSLTPVEEHDIWVACRGDSSVYIVDLGSFTCSDTLRFDQPPSDIRFSPDGYRAYVALQDFGGIYVYNTHPLELVRTLQAGPGPMDLAIDRDGRVLVASDSTLGRVKVWDLWDHQEWSLPVGGSAGRVRYSRSPRFFVISMDENHVISVDTSVEPPVIADTIHVPAQVRELALWEIQP